MSTERSMLSHGRRHPAVTRQRGITLIVVLILLVVVTILGIGGTRIALLSERSTRFDRDYQVAWQAAEAALVDAEYDIYGPNTSANQRVATFTPDNEQAFLEGGCGTTHATRGLCLPGPATSLWQSVDFMNESNTAPSVGYGDKTGFTLVSGNVGVQPSRRPRYIIERAQSTGFTESAVLQQHSLEQQQPKPVIYRITAMGFGPSDQVQVLMQSTYSRGVRP